MAEFDPSGPWDRTLDVRDWDNFANRIRQGQPRGSLWLLVGTRRSGKTWGLGALKSALGGRVINLRDEGTGALTAAAHDERLLVDEPGSHLRGHDVGQEQAARRPERFLEWCHERKRAGVPVLLALTPGEFDLLAVASRGQARVEWEDVEFVQALTPARAQQKAKRRQDTDWVERNDWAHGFVEELLRVAPG
jgi:hypothetical protein